MSLTVVLSPLASNGGSKRINLGGRPGLLPVPNLLLPRPRPRPLDLREERNRELGHMGSNVMEMKEKI